MPKLIDYPRTSYTGAWELAEIVDDTGGKCAIETAARKLNRKVSGSFKAIIGSAVKFGLMTSKRDLLTTTTLFRRIKHAYDKAEELQFHREAFLTPPLFTQLCRKFRNRELPVQMLDVMLIREFGVEEINAQNVAKAFVDGCRMCGLLDERNIIADIDGQNASRAPRRELATTSPPLQTFTAPSGAHVATGPIPQTSAEPNSSSSAIGLFSQAADSFTHQPRPQSELRDSADAVANLFGFADNSGQPDLSGAVMTHPYEALAATETISNAEPTTALGKSPTAPFAFAQSTGVINYQMQMSGPGVNTSLDISDEADLSIAIALLEKIRRQLRTGN